MKPEFRLHAVLESSLAPSEDTRKVLAAMENIIGGSQYTTSENRWRIRMESDDRSCLEKIHDQLRDRRVRGAARRLLLTGMKEGSTTVMLNRQAAAAGVIALCSSEGESALGPIYLTIESQTIVEVIDWLTAIEERESRVD